MSNLATLPKPSAKPDLNAIAGETAGQDYRYTMLPTWLRWLDSDYFRGGVDVFERRHAGRHEDRQASRCDDVDERKIVDVARGDL